MVPHVDLWKTSSVEELSTDCADERFLASVYHEVSLEMTFSFEAFITLIAVVRATLILMLIQSLRESWREREERSRLKNICRNYK